MLSQNGGKAIDLFSPAGIRQVCADPLDKQLVYVCNPEKEAAMPVCLQTLFCLAHDIPCVLPDWIEISVSTGKSIPIDLFRLIPPGTRSSVSRDETHADMGELFAGQRPVQLVPHFASGPQTQRCVLQTVCCFLPLLPCTGSLFLSEREREILKKERDTFSPL